MFETAGAPTIIEPDGSIAWLVLLPLWSALACVLTTFRRSGTRASRDRVAATVTIAAHGAWLSLAIALSLRLVFMPSGRTLFQHVAQLARLGQLDLTLDFALDPTAAALSVLVSFVGLASALYTSFTAVRSASDEAEVVPRLGWISLLGAAVNLVVISETWPFVVAGLELALLATWGLSRGASSRRVGLALAGDALVAIAGVLLFWSLGGTFSPFGYTPDAQPRYALVAATNQEAPAGKSRLTLSSYAGALMVADDGPPLPNEPIKSPFSIILEPGNYSFRIQAGVASSDNVVSHVALAPGHAYVLTPFGPTSSFRALSDEIVVPRPSALGQGSARAVLATRTVLGVKTSVFVCWLTMIGLLMRLALLARHGPPRVAAALEAVPVIAVALRVAPLVEPTLFSTGLLAVVAASVAVVLAADAAAARDPHRAVRGALAAVTALAVVSVVVGDSPSAIVLAVAVVLGAAAATCGAAGDGDPRWLGVACAALTGLLPGAGISAGTAALLTTGLAQAELPKIAAAISVVALALVSLAVFHVYGARINSGARGHKQIGARGVVAVLSVASLSVGAALGVATSPFGGRAAPIARRLVVGASTVIDGSPKLFALGLLATIGAAVFGMLTAHRASDKGAGWLAVLDLPGRACGRAVGLVGAAAQRVEVGVASIDEHVIEDMIGITASVAHRIRKPTAPADGGKLRDRLRLGALLLLICLLGSVVLSSVMLR